MNKRLIFLVIPILLLVVGVMFSEPFFKPYENTDTVINKIGCRLFELNVLNVRTKGNIDLSKIEIKKGNRVVFSNGNQKDKIGQEYGGMALDIYYANELISTIGHFKTNNWYTYKYDIELTKHKGMVEVNWEIEGPGYPNRYSLDELIKNYTFIIKKLN